MFFRTPRLYEVKYRRSSEGQLIFSWPTIHTSRRGAARDLRSYFRDYLPDEKIDIVAILG